MKIDNHILAKNWLPPIDYACDYLFVNNGGYKPSFQMVKMDFKGRGCGSWAWKFLNEQTLILPKGRFIHAGYNYLLEWTAKKNG